MSDAKLLVCRKPLELWFPNLDVRPRGATMLDGPGARSKFGIPMVESDVFWKQMYCILRKHRWHYWDYSALPQVIRRPSSHSAPP